MRRRILIYSSVITFVIIAAAIVLVLLLSDKPEFIEEPAISTSSEVVDLFSFDPSDVMYVSFLPSAGAAYDLRYDQARGIIELESPYAVFPGFQMQVETLFMISISMT